MTDDLKPDLNLDEGFGRTVDQMFDLFVRPEIERRVQAGTLSADFRLSAFQVLFYPDGNKAVRLNDEVRGAAIVQADAGTELEIGDQLPISSIKKFQRFDLPEEELDAGHFTLLRLDGNWVGTFDFRSRRAYCDRLLKKSEEFIRAARLLSENDLQSPLLETLFAACELISKVHLILHHGISAEASSHGAISSRINRWRQLGNVCPEFVTLFNELGQARSTSRYGPDATKRPVVTAETLKMVEGELTALRLAIRPKFQGG